MLAKSHRFHGHNSLRYVYQKGTTVRTPLISLKFVLNSRRKTYRAAVVVSRKVNKSAVVRNRIRRRIYEAIRLEEVNEPYDLIFTVFSDKMATMEKAALQETIHSLITKPKAK